MPHTNSHHDEVASMIGSSRETVNRVFSGVKRKKLLDIHGSTLVILNKKALQHIAGV
jgi:CRP/FNR family transcriptional regulator, cyclic AMP receptor protein